MSAEQPSLFDLGVPVEKRRFTEEVRPVESLKSTERYLVVAYWRGGWWRAFTAPSTLGAVRSWDIATLEAAREVVSSLPRGWSHARIYQVRLP